MPCTYQELTPAKWHLKEHNLFEKVMKTGYSGVYEKEYIRKDGSIFPIRIQAWLIMDEKHKPSRLLGIVQDISGEKKEEEIAIIKDTGHHIVFEQPQALSVLLRYWLMYF